MALAFLALAAADTGYPLCEGELTSTTWPPIGATEVPLDAVPAVVFGAHPCDSYIPATATLSPEGGEAIAQATGDAQRGFLELLPSEALLPNTPYVLDIDATAQTQSAGFSTGELPSEPAEGTAIVSNLRAEHRTVMNAAEWPFEEVTLSLVGLDVTGASDSSGQFVVRFAEGPPGDAECCFGGAILANGSSTDASWASPSLPGVGEEWCVWPVVRNPDGSLQTPMSEVCTIVETYDYRDGMGRDPGACQCGGGGAPGVLVFLAGLYLAWGRRRSDIG